MIDHAKHLAAIHREASQSPRGIPRGGLHGGARAFLAVDSLDDPSRSVTDHLPVTLGWGMGSKWQENQGREEECFHAKWSPGLNKTP